MTFCIYVLQRMLKEKSNRDDQQNQSYSLKVYINPAMAEQGRNREATDKAILGLKGDIVIEKTDLLDK